MRVLQISSPLLLVGYLLVMFSTAELVSQPRNAQPAPALTILLLNISSPSKQVYAIELPFPVVFHRRNRDTLYVGENSFITFEPQTASEVAELTAPRLLLEAGATRAVAIEVQAYEAIVVVRYVGRCQGSSVTTLEWTVTFFNEPYEHFEVEILLHDVPATLGGISSLCSADSCYQPLPMDVGRLAYWDCGADCFDPTGETCVPGVSGCSVCDSQFWTAGKQQCTICVRGYQLNAVTGNCEYCTNGTVLQSSCADLIEQCLVYLSYKPNDCSICTSGYSGTKCQAIATETVVSSDSGDGDHHDSDHDGGTQTCSTGYTYVSGSCRACGGCSVCSTSPCYSCQGSTLNCTTSMNNSSAGIIAGGVVGGLAGLGLLVGFAVCCWRYVNDPNFCRKPRIYGPDSDYRPDPNQQQDSMGDLGQEPQPRRGNIIPGRPIDPYMLPLPPAQPPARMPLANRSMQEVTRETCPVCCEMRPDAITHCGHPFHATCLQQWYSRNQSCPTCRRTESSSYRACSNCGLFRVPLTASGRMPPNQLCYNCRDQQR